MTYTWYTAAVGAAAVPVTFLLAVRTRTTNLLCYRIALPACTDTSIVCTAGYPPINTSKLVSTSSLFR